MFPGEAKDLARISHQISAAAVDPGMSTALRSIGFLDVLSSTPAESFRRAPCIHARLRRLATKPGEKCGLTSILGFTRNGGRGLSLVNIGGLRGPGVGSYRQVRIRSRRYLPVTDASFPMISCRRPAATT